MIEKEAMDTKQKTGIWIIALGLAAAGMWWMLSPSHDPNANKRPSIAQPVTSHPVEARAVPVRVDAVGRVQSLAEVPLRARVDGEIMGVHFAEGDMVKEGQLLFTLDTRQAETVRRTAEANLQRAKAQLVRAQADLERYQKLLKSGSATRQRVEQALSEVGALEGDINASQAAIDSANLHIDFAHVRAPVSGRTGVINFKLGSLARVGDTEPLVTVTQMSPITVAFSVAETHLPRIRQAINRGTLSVTATSGYDKDMRETGTLTFIDSTIDSASGTILLKGTFANDDGRLWPGQFVTASLMLGLEDQALVIPAQAVQMGQQGAYVYVIGPDDTATLRPVTVDREQDGLAVISKGLQAGERVVSEGQMRLAPGTKVQERTETPKPQ